MCAGTCECIPKHDGKSDYLKGARIACPHSMGAVVNFLGIMALAGVVGVGLKSLDGFFEYTDSG